MSCPTGFDECTYAYLASRWQPRTSVQTVHLSGFVTDPTSQTPLELSLTRAEPALPKIELIHPDGIAMHDDEIPTIEDLPINPPSQPSPEDDVVQLHLKIGTLLSGNKRHAVYNVEVVHDTSPAFYIPPLVIKVSVNPERGKALAQEAGLYGHLEPLQGVVAPRCYGYFRAEREGHGAWQVRSVRTGYESSSPLANDHAVWELLRLVYITVESVDCGVSK